MRVQSDQGAINTKEGELVALSASVGKVDYLRMLYLSDLGVQTAFTTVIYEDNLTLKSGDVSSNMMNRDSIKCPSGIQSKGLEIVLWALLVSIGRCSHQAIGQGCLPPCAHQGEYASCR